MKQLARWGMAGGLYLALAAPAVAVFDVAVSRTVVQIRGMDAAGKLYFGSGVIVGPDTVATNCHVVRTGGRIGVFRGAESYPVRAERVDVSRDLCLLQAPGLAPPSAKPAPLAALKAGQPLSFYGFPRALGLSYSEGRLKRLHPFGGSRVIETTAFFTLGGSGGGLFDGRGRLAGLATFLAPGHGGAYFAIPADWIRALTSRPWSAVAPLPGRSFWEETSHGPAFLQRPGAPGR